MKTLQLQGESETVVQFEPMIGTIDNAISEAIEYLKMHKSNKVGTFDFNGVTVCVCHDSRPDLILREWHRAMDGFRDKVVYPYPAEELTQEEQDNDRRLQAEKDKQAAIEAKKQEAEDTKKRMELAQRLADAPPIELSDPEGWKKSVDANQDPYGAATLRYTEAWARLMQAGVRDGHKLEDIASPTSFEADAEGITGFMQSYAKQLLIRCWVHGEELRGCNA